MPARPSWARIVALTGGLLLFAALPLRAATFTLNGDPTSINGATWTLRDTVDAVVYDLAGILFEPAGAGPWPAVLVSHGAGGNAYGYSRTIARTMRDWGLVAIGVHYTHAGQVPVGSPGTANDRGASDANLLRAERTLALLATRAKADTARLAAHGHSMGGFVTAALVGTSSRDFLVASHSAAGIDDSKAAFTKTAQAIGISCAYQMHHGDVDTTVDLACDQRLDSLLTATGAVHELHVYPGYGHSLIPFDPTMLGRVHDWYEQHDLWASTTGVAPSSGSAGLRIEAVRASGGRITLAIAWPADGFARVELFDVLGRRAATLMAAEASPGLQTITCPWSQAQAGVWFVRAQQHGTVAVRRFVLLR